MIKLEKLSLTIGALPILRDVDLAIHPGKVTGLVGESGSGKSMTALAVMRLLPVAARVSGGSSWTISIFWTFPNATCAPFAATGSE